MVNTFLYDSMAGVGGGGTQKDQLALEGKTFKLNIDLQLWQLEK